MAKTPYPVAWRLEIAIERRYQMSKFRVKWPPRRIQTRPTGGAYVGIGWLVRGSGERVVGWDITAGPKATPRMEYLEGEFVVLDTDIE